MAYSFVSCSEEKNGVSYAGTHLLIDMWGANNLSDLFHIEQAIRLAVIECSATLLNLYLHHFTLNHGVSGVAVLAESHIDPSYFALLSNLLF